MFELKIPALGHYNFKYIIFDYNGTLAKDGKLCDKLAQRLVALSRILEVHVLTLDTFGSVREQLKELPVQIAVIQSEDGTAGKGAYIEDLGPDLCIAVGNGSNDCKLIKKARLGIAVVGSEGLSSKALGAADLIFTSIDDVFDSLENPSRLVATLRE